VTILGNSNGKEMVTVAILGLMVLVATIEVPFFFVGASWWNRRHP
jgi:hypothetical protein